MPFLGRLAGLGAGAIIPEGSASIQETPIGAGPLKFVRREMGNEVELESLMTTGMDQHV